MGLARITVKKWIRAATFREHARRPPRTGLLASHTGYLRQRWQEGCCKATRLYEEVKAKGFSGSLAIVQRYVQPWRQNSTDANPILREGPLSPRMVRWWLLGHLSKNDPQRKAEQETFVQRLCSDCPEIHAA